MKLGFLLLIGVPGSGKTTFAKYLVKNYERSNESGYHFIHVCYDDLIHFQDGNHEFEWKSARNSVSVKVVELLSAIKSKNVDLCPDEFKNHFISVTNWDSNFVLILDDNMYFKSMRYSLFQIAKKHRVGFCQVFFNCSLDNAIKANNLRDPDLKVPSQVIENMHSKIEPPNSKSNWERYSVELNSFCDLNGVDSKVLPTLSESLNNTSYDNDDTEMKELSKIQCKKNVVHQTDIGLRKIISWKIKKHLNENSRQELRDYTVALNLRKSEILADVRTGNICLPEEVLSEINLDLVEKFALIHFLDGYF